MAAVCFVSRELHWLGAAAGRPLSARVAAKVLELTYRLPACLFQESTE